jgi:hypothetical protein
VRDAIEHLHQRPDPHVEAGLFANLTHDGVLERLAELDGTTGQAPLPRHWRLSAPHQQHTIVLDDNRTDTQVLTLAVAEPESPLTIVTRSVPNATIGQEYEFEIVTTGGTAGSTLTWTVTGLPDGLLVSEDGVLGGTPTMEGDYTASFTCNGAADTPEGEEVLVFAGTQNVTVTANQTTTIAFAPVS